MAIYHPALYEMVGIVEVPLEPTNEFRQNLCVRVVVIEGNVVDCFYEYVPLRASAKCGNEVFGAREFHIEVEAFFYALYVMEDLFLFGEQIGIN